MTRRLVPDEVFDQVLAEVVDGGIGAGEPLRSERRLAEVLGVSRPAVREALQRMAQTRLLEVRHGGATTVRDFRRYAGMDLLPRLLVRGGCWTRPSPAACLRRAWSSARGRGVGRRARRDPRSRPC